MHKQRELGVCVTQLFSNTPVDCICLRLDLHMCYNHKLWAAEFIMETNIREMFDSISRVEQKNDVTVYNKEARNAPQKPIVYKRQNL